MWSNKSQLILHGEDDVADARAMTRMLSRFKYEGTYENLPRGNEILDRVLMSGDFADRELARPDLILLDVGLPVLTGIEVLQALRANDDTKAIPVIILSGSSSVRDFHHCIGLGANGYIQKTPDMEKMASICDSLFGAWMQMSSQEFF